MDNSKKDEIQHSLGYESVAGWASRPTEIPGLTSTLSRDTVTDFFFPDSPYPVLVLSNPASWNGLFKTEISILLCQFSPFPCPIIYGIKVTLFPFDEPQGFAWPGFCLLLEMFFLFFLILRRKFFLILKDKSLKKTILVPILQRVHYSFFLLELHLVIKTYCQ